MKQVIVSCARGVFHVLASMGITLMHQRLEHQRWSLIPDESPELTQWHGSDPYIASVLNPHTEE